MEADAVKYKAMVRIWNDSPDRIFSDYITGELSGIEHDTAEEAEKEIGEEAAKNEGHHDRMDFYVSAIDEDTLEVDGE